jgi:hypothetical protein
MRGGLKRVNHRQTGSNEKQTQILPFRSAQRQDDNLRGSLKR